jgi:hypothetical protein
MTFDSSDEAGIFRLQSQKSTCPEVTLQLQQARHEPN